MTFRRADEQDIGALHALIESAYRGESARRGWTHEADLLGGQRTDLEALRAIMDDPDQVILIAEQEGILQGCVQLSRVDGTTAYLGLLTVDPSLQAGGLGKRLLVHSEDYVRDMWGCQAIEMTVIKQRGELIAYYERRGYIRTGEYRPFPHGDPRFGLPKTGKLEFAVLRKEI
ncbi:MAG: GNAT family N-acetyltransferase [Sphingomonadales bacterium]|nr:GNAT family N-acetyltransferase [Sphingomonadales bacterium]PIX64803.1 MAG: GNAT family N-acetyltransferase [Sphingomonadales bacterium CG_4_10_14_3_um_filter_58_15]NCO48250.1 GNAT family N-acetyltransferase [Sphingomonadales bacterium]NCO99721.1 GNAT family N-acetyltransferase [Sphingomonadales bacterium]NCP27404.1 GNAT family N-acetyltransferase [Sphingomonadales bacterium]